MAEGGKKSTSDVRVVICGGGIIGVSIAYYLAEKGVAATIIERRSVACAASGRAGGFLAKNWCDHNELGHLARKSFEMHKELAEKFGASKIDYRLLDTFQVDSLEGFHSDSDSGKPDWIDGCVTSVATLGNTSTTAQVHPYKLTHAMLEEAQKKGVKLIKGAVEGIKSTHDKRPKVQGVKIADQEEPIPCDIVVIAMGPWSHMASQWFARLPKVKGHRAHSIMVKPPTPFPAHACFIEHRLKNGITRSPEIYCRPDGEVYICGLGDDPELPDNPEDVKPDPETGEKLLGIVGEISTKLGQADIQRKSACFYPVSPDGTPLIGKITTAEGAYIATGHSCWGILNAPVTGAAMAELIVDGQASIVDLKEFSPKRFWEMGWY
ncbi:putative oxidoreductase TDA3 [Lingula anatina]|uniref:Oxidoreductase TDA3 n=1 Tax=Lingula anatina TaxID=7574 RepID=A0A1S3KG89_LINAN|nr:putative oxidoreductase TDA3 [Lingula anatina]XP_013421479.1 putative oxidoreductase TDA3 [Lingula anatina]|eukprot:XP_013421478.1 putative oxidoreductase TDA3 [Lingula anatina]